MSCICQYIVNSSSEMNSPQELESFLHSRSDETEAAETAEETQQAAIDTNTEAVTDDVKISVCVSELVSCRAENWLLKKKLHDYEVTIDNLEQLMTTIMGKQHKILGEMYQLRKRNRELQIECNLQREYHSMERNALVKELHDVKTLSRDRLFDAPGDEQEQEEHNQTPDSLDYMDEEYGFRKESDDDDENEEEQVSSPISTSPSSVDTSPYSSEPLDSDESQESEEDDDDLEDYSAISDSDSD